MSNLSQAIQSSWNSPTKDVALCRGRKSHFQTASYLSKKTLGSKSLSYVQSETSTIPAHPSVTQWEVLIIPQNFGTSKLHRETTPLISKGFGMEKLPVCLSENRASSISCWLILSNSSSNSLCSSDQRNVGNQNVEEPTKCKYPSNETNLKFKGVSLGIHPTKT